MRTQKAVESETLEDRVALSGGALNQAILLQRATVEIFYPGDPVFVSVQVSGVLTSSGQLDVKILTPSDPIIPPNPIRVLLLGSNDEPPVEFTGFIASDYIHAVTPGDPILPPPLT
jgi:hypothetical protein